jgi:endo-1,4-beta-D-glucanase Y
MKCVNTFLTHSAIAYITLLILAGAGQPAWAGARWPLWENYAARFLNDQGRIVDHDAADRTTSEGQSYALFFALIANDRPRFGQILTWTDQNLAKDGLSSQLPAWLWGKETGGAWRVLDGNPAADSDLWIAYTLLEAARLWEEPALRAIGLSLANRILKEEVLDIPGLGPMLIPGPIGFHSKPDFYQLNPSYLPLQLFLRLATEMPGTAWNAVAEGVPLVVRGSAPKGFAMDWIAYRPPSGFTLEPGPAAAPVASYDAIRVYLWAGMLDVKTPHRQAILNSLQGMLGYLRAHGAPPAEVMENGAVKDPNGGPGFSAALIPYLRALNEAAILEGQTERLRSQLNPHTGLYGTRPRYYDQNLALFSTGWTEKRFSFDSVGKLRVTWRS